MKLICETPIRSSLSCDLVNCGCRINTFIWVSDTLQAVYYETPKAACTSIKDALDIRVTSEDVMRAYALHLNTGRGVSFDASMPERIKAFLTLALTKHRKNQTDLPLFGDPVGRYGFQLFYGSFPDSITLFDSYYKFSFVRDPFSRALSNYKMFFSGSAFRQKQAKKLFGQSAENIDFKDFVDACRSVYNHHWEPYYKFLGDGQHLDKLGRLESITAHWNSVRSSLLIPDLLPQKNKSACADIHYGLEDERIVRSIYNVDYCSFGY